jgi:hypothetical protein
MQMGQAGSGSRLPLWVGLIGERHIEREGLIVICDMRVGLIDRSCLPLWGEGWGFIVVTLWWV